MVGRDGGGSESGEGVMGAAVGVGAVVGVEKV